MAIEIAESDRHFFGFLYTVIADFADAPDLAISRISGGRFFVADDLASTLSNYYRLVHNKYPAAADLELMQFAAKLDAIFASRSRGGNGFDEMFWTNEGFQNHPDWQRIREEARTFLMR